MLTRRNACAVMATFAAPPSIRAESLGSAEWRQTYETSGSTGGARTATPVLSPSTPQAVEAAIAQYREIAARGGWTQTPAGDYRIGAAGPHVTALRQRLMVTGDLSDGQRGAIYDSFVETAIKRFQRRHGIIATGAASDQTVRALNISVETRIRQLEINLIRLRSLTGGDLGDRFVMVNIPAAQIEAVEGGQVISRHAAGVGKDDRQSPVMSAKINEVNFNPFWTVPASIIRKDLIPKMRSEPNYLTQNRIRIYNQQGVEVKPGQVNWASDEATRYMFRQDPGGEFNSLGFVRINIPNPHGVYMHDTPAKGIFGDDDRFVSSGCVRVQNVRAFVEWLLKSNPGWDAMRISEEFQSGRRTDLRLNQPVNVYWIYVTAWATPGGVVHFAEDIYRRDNDEPRRS